MTHLPRRIPKPKSGTENIDNHGEPSGFSIIDFWRWSTSDLLSNSTRGVFAEFIVRQALNITTPDVRDEWDAFDLLTPEGIKVEVKSSAYIQSWAQKDYSKIYFSIKPSRGWNNQTGKIDTEYKRQADVYVFCLLKHKEQETVNPLAMEQWEFYVVPTQTLNEVCKNVHQLSLTALQRLSPPIGYYDLRKKLKY